MTREGKGEELGLRGLFVVIPTAAAAHSAQRAETLSAMTLALASPMVEIERLLAAPMPKSDLVPLKGSEAECENARETTRRAASLLRALRVCAAREQPSHPSVIRGRLEAARLLREAAGHQIRDDTARVYCARAGAWLELVRRCPRCGGGALEIPC